jgi:tRNA A37 threonylcarbamoyladenosine synthetase subunit TsaC/SUA5/YrdC
LRVPENYIANALLDELGQPLLGTTLILPNEVDPLTCADTIRERLEKLIDLVIDGGACHLEPTTVIDLTEEQPILVRQGRGNAAQFGL